MFAWIEQKEDTKHLVQATLSRTGLHEIRKVRIKVRRQELTITTYYYQDQFFQWSLKVSNSSWGLLRQRAAQKIACRRQLEQDRKSMEKLYSGEERETSKSSRWQQNAADNILPIFCDAVSWTCSFHSNVSADSTSSFFKRCESQTTTCAGAVKEFCYFFKREDDQPITSTNLNEQVLFGCSRGLELSDFEDLWICKNDFKRKNLSKRQEMDLFHGLSNLFLSISLFGVRVLFVQHWFEVNVSVATFLKFQARCQKALP